jgi:hypothetical protein
MATYGETTFIHGIRADEPHSLDVWNFSLKGTRTSMGLVNTAIQVTSRHMTSI